MRLKKQYLAIIVVVMVVFTVFIASFVVSSVQGSRVAYLALRADKAVYGLDENVTFTLSPLSQGVDFTIGGDEANSCIKVIRLPDDVDPETFFDDREALDNLSQLSYGGPWSVKADIPIPYFSSNGEALKMSWNGSLGFWDSMNNNMSWGRATSGFYVLYPNIHDWYGSSSTKIFLDRSSIFYLGGLKVDLNVTHDDERFTILVDLSLTEGTEEINGMFSTSYTDFANDTEGEIIHQNQTVDLTAGNVAHISVHRPLVGSEYVVPTTSMIGKFMTGDTTFVFGIYQEVHYVQLPNGTVVWEVRNVQF